MKTFIRLLRQFARWIIAITDDVDFAALEWNKYEPEYTVDAPSVFAKDHELTTLAVLDAMQHCAVPTEGVTLDTDIARTGKLNDVIHFTAERLSVGHPLRTVGDIVRLFAELK